MTAPTSVAISIAPTDISMGPPNIVVVTSSTLLNVLVQDAAAAVEVLSAEVAKLDISTVSVDSEGRIVIDDAAFAAKLRSNVTADMSTNGTNQGVCGSANISCRHATMM